MIPPLLWNPFSIRKSDSSMEWMFIMLLRGSRPPKSNARYLGGSVTDPNMRRRNPLPQIWSFFVEEILAGMTDHIPCVVWLTILRGKPSVINHHFRSAVSPSDNYEFTWKKGMFPCPEHYVRNDTITIQEYRYNRTTWEFLPIFKDYSMYMVQLL